MLPTWLLDLVFPRFCVSCARFGTYWCGSCHNQLSFLAGPLRLRLEENSVAESWAAVRHQSPASKLVTQLKYGSVKALSLVIAQIMWLALPRPVGSLVTSVPLHPKRQRQRGFNQAELLAVELARLWELPYRPVLKRTRYTSAQAGVSSRTERLTHLDAAFEPLYSNLPQQIILVDDVITTGTTTHQCGLTMRSAGARTITAVSFAHKTR